MNIENQTLQSLAKLLADGEVSAVELTKTYLQRIASIDKQLNAFVTVCEDEALEQARQADQRRQKEKDNASPLLGIPIALKDNLCTNGVRTTNSSRMLENFVPPYDATVVQRIHEAGMPVLGKTNLDEFSMGSSTETSAFGPTKNPWDVQRVPGGSSGGSAAAVSAGLTPAALGSDSGGSIRQPAALCGVVGLKPTYGRVSRYGMVAFAPSFDQIGPFTRTVADSAYILQHIAGHDSMDGTSAREDVPDFVSALDAGVKGKKIGVPTEYFSGELAEHINPEVLQAVEHALQKLVTQGAELVEISLPNVKHALAAYYAIASVEGSSSLGRYDGVRYGHRSEDSPDVTTMFQNTRQEGFGLEAKRRILFGRHLVTGERYEKVYRRAMQVRTLIKREWVEHLKTCDAIALPTTPDVAFPLGEKAQDNMAMYVADLCTIPVNLAGLPAMNVPIGLSENKLPIGMQLVGRAFGEQQLLQAAYTLEQGVDTFPLAPLATTHV